MIERKYTRFAVQLPVSFSGDELSDGGTILNLSAEGCAITSDTVARAAVYLQLKMQLRDRGADPGRSGSGQVVFRGEIRC